MTYQVDINGRTRTVTVERGASGYVVVVDGRQHGLDVTPVNGAISLIFDDGRSYEVSIGEHPRGSGNLTVHVNGRVVAAAVDASRGSWSRRGQDGSSAGQGPHHVTAPMPGKVVRVLVKPGDQVAPRQGVVVVEAMKMENELRSPKAGVVSEVKVTEGASVEAGAILVVIE
jgi:biotin carboxyl carrier protein